MKSTNVTMLAFAGALCVALASPSALSTPKAHARTNGFHFPLALPTYLAGYQITEPGISRASVTFTLPAVTCPTTDFQGVAFGIGNQQSPSNPTLLAAGRVICSGGSPQYGMGVNAGGHIQLTSISAGDKISVLIVQTRNKVTATVTDLTIPETLTASGTPTPDNTMTIGAFPFSSGSTPLPVADFGRLWIYQPTFENTYLQDWSATKLTRKNGSTVQIVTGPFTPSGAFALTFEHN